MNKLLTIALAAALCTPAFAQKMGGSNRNAPTVNQSIVLGDHSMTLNYTAITWADGSTMEALLDKENGGSMRARVNKSAPSAPLATFKTTMDCKCGDLSLAAGDYEVYFTINDDCEWQINFHADGKDKPSTMKLELMDTPEPNKRLLMCLYAGDKGAGTYVAFGDKFGMLAFEHAPKKKS